MPTYRALGVVVADEDRRETRAVPDAVKLLDARHEIGEHRSATGPPGIRLRRGRWSRELAAVTERDQWRKWRSPVKTMATPSSLALAMFSSSRTEPPGWTITATPASAAASMPSGNG